MSYFFVTQHYSGLIDALKEENRYYAGQLSDYKKAFPGQSADDIVREIGKLEGAITTQNTVIDRMAGSPVQRRLTKTQKEKLETALKPFVKKPKTIVVYATFDFRGEAIIYANQIAHFMREDGINVTDAIQAIGKPYDMGIMVGKAYPHWSGTTRFCATSCSALCRASTPQT
jgi:hypothetical protein